VRYPAVLSEPLTIQRALDGANLARFGDGELKLALGHDAKSQRHHPDLEKALRRVLRDWRGRVLPCIPNIGRRQSPKEPFWSQYRADRYLRLYDAGGFYGSSFVTRPDSSPVGFDQAYWDLVARLWRGREVVVVGGSGKSIKAADLEGATGVEEIEAPRQHAWDMHAELLDRLKGEKRRVFLCIGATATVLAWELAQFRVHALDLGHLAMFKRKVSAGEPLVVTDDDRAMP
jgi:hypothetical protein